MDKGKGGQVKSSETNRNLKGGASIMQALKEWLRRGRAPEPES